MAALPLQRPLPPRPRRRLSGGRVPRGVALAVAAAAAAAAAVGGARGEALVTEKDYETLALADKKMQEHCKDIKSAPLKKKAARQNLLDALGGTNFILDALKEAKSEEDLTEKVQEKLDFVWLGLRALPLVASFLAVLLWLCCCWHGCPCCKCCRCCQKERRSGPVSRVVYIISLLVIACLVCYCAHLNLSGYGQCQGGFDRLNCQVSTLLNGTLGGEDDPYFIGLMPVLNTIEKLKDETKPNSPMLTNVGATIDETKTVSQAVTLTADTLDLLKKNLQDGQLMRPRSTTGTDLLHFCSFCAAASSSVQSASVALKDGVGVALDGARTEIKKQISSDALSSLSGQLDTALAPLGQFKDTVRDTLDPFLSGDNMNNIKKHVDTTLKYLVIALVFWAFVFVLFACTSMSCWVCREKVYAREQHALEEGRPTKYARHPHRLACCVWACAIFMIFPALFFGGILSAISLPLSAVCLTLDDFDSSVLYEVAPAIGMNISGDQGEQLAGMIDNCLATENETLNANVMDLIFTRNETDGKKIPMRAEMLKMITEPVDTVFKTLDQVAGGTGSITLSDSAPIVELRKTLREKVVDAMLIPVADDIRDLADYKDLFLKHSDAILTISRCSNFTLEGSTAPGIDALTGEMNSWPDVTVVANPLLDCDDATIGCTSGGANEAACEAGKKFLALKRKVIDSATTKYKCHYFVDASGAECDVENMVTDASGKYINDCMISQGDEKVTQTGSKDCSLAQLRDHIKKFDDRLETVFKRLDDESAAMMPKISNGMRNAIDTYLINPVKAIINGVTCGFMPAFWQGTIDSLCYQGVYGFRLIAWSYVVLGSVITLLALLMNCFWRRTVDNVNSDIYGWGLTDRPSSSE